LSNVSCMQAVLPQVIFRPIHLKLHFKPSELQHLQLPFHVPMDAVGAVTSVELSPGTCITKMLLMPSAWTHLRDVTLTKLNLEDIPAALKFAASAERLVLQVQVPCQKDSQRHNQHSDADNALADVYFVGKLCN